AELMHDAGVHSNGPSIGAKCKRMRSASEFAQSLWQSTQRRMSDSENLIGVVRELSRRFARWNLTVMDTRLHNAMAGDDYDHNSVDVISGVGSSHGGSGDPARNARPGCETRIPQNRALEIARW